MLSSLRAGGGWTAQQVSLAQLCYCPETCHCLWDSLPWDGEGLCSGLEKGAFLYPQCAGDEPLVTSGHFFGFRSRV